MLSSLQACSQNMANTKHMQVNPLYAKIMHGRKNTMYITDNKTKKDKNIYIKYMHCKKLYSQSVSAAHVFILLIELLTLHNLSNLFTQLYEIQLDI